MNDSIKDTEELHEDEQATTDQPTTDQSEEEVAAEQAETAADEQDNSLEAQLEKAEAKATENWEQYLRAVAEMDNLRRRNTKDVENAHKYGMEKFVTEMLPVVDGLGMGLATENASAESLREGMVLTMNMIEKMMEKLGIVEINPENEPFDADKHQAMSMQPSADVEPNTVIAVMQKGYMLNDRLIRPAMVMVSKAPE